MATTAEVARQAGVHRDTLLRWLREGLVPEPGRDHRGWRIFSETEASAVVRFARARSTGSQSALASALHPEIARLEHLDWDFADASTDYLTHGLHPYPAKFIPQIPNALIQELSSVGDRVADIFCGSGTTLVEALLLKRNAVGIDASPLACLITRAKTTRLSDGAREHLLELIDRAEQLGREFSSIAGEYLLFESPAFQSSADRPDDEALDFWFEPFVVEELAEIRSWCMSLRASGARDVALAAFSSIIVTVSRQDSDTRYVRREKGTRAGDAFRRFSRALSDALAGALEFADLVEPRFTSEVLQADIRQELDVEEVDLVVCSPPYPNAYSYHLYHRTRMLWLEMDQPTFKRQEIGSHRKYSSKARGAATAETFQEEMDGILDWTERHLSGGSYACFVVGNSRIRGRDVNNAEIISASGTKAGLREVTRIGRKIQATKKSFNPSIGKIKTEQILVLRKES